MEQPARKRSPATESLLAGAGPKHWIYGQTIITVTAGTSGWAEVLVRKPVARLSWIQRLHNPNRDENIDDLEGHLPQFLTGWGKKREKKREKEEKKKKKKKERKKKKRKKEKT